jgi:hypothetical protein
MMPAATDLLRDLHRLTGGDVALSKQAIRRIRDHGYRLDQAEAEVDARIQAVRDREKP